MKSNTKEVKNITHTEWENEVMKSDGSVLVDFWAPWCGPCRMVGPAIDEIARENKFGVKFVKVNVDENPSIASEYNIQSIPTIAIFKNGKIIRTTIGAQSKSAYEKLISEAL
ncbi:MAG: thioredoxin [Candidatus Nitrosotenuis sp.]|nr:MAG: thioredoxin [Candidatus Nitrosotenuis sp.]